MKKFVSVVTAGAAFAVLASPASAAVNGGRVEALAGWDRGSIDFGDFGFDDSIDSDGIVFGIGAGYDFGVNATTSVGIDLEATESTADLDLTDGTDSAEVALGRDLYAGGRITFAVSPTTNVYLKAGYTNARIKATVTEGAVVVSDSANADGIRGGIGAQFALGGNAYVGGEYRYSNYEADFSRHQVVATLGYRF
jgi:outer membrane immunogenic protein